MLGILCCCMRGLAVPTAIAANITSAQRRCNQGHMSLVYSYQEGKLLGRQNTFIIKPVCFQMSRTRKEINQMTTPSRFPDAFKAVKIILFTRKVIFLFWSTTIPYQILKNIFLNNKSDIHKTHI